MSDALLNGKVGYQMLELAERRLDEIAQACYERVTRPQIVQALTGDDPEEVIPVPGWEEISPIERQIHRGYARVAMHELVAAATL